MLKVLIACCLMATPVAVAAQRPEMPSGTHCLELEGTPKQQCFQAHIEALQAYWKVYPIEGYDRSNQSLSSLRNEIEANHAEVEYHREKGRYDARRYLRGR